MEWQPIESAPKNRTWILVAGKHSRGGSEMLVVRWDGDPAWESGDDGYQPYLEPTHWMPLPPPPAA